MSDAIHRTIAAGDLDEAAELIAEHWATTLLLGAGDRTLSGWMQALPPERIRGDLRLCIANCFATSSLGAMDELAEWIAAAEQAPLPGPFRDGFASREGAIECVRGAYLWQTGDAGAALEAGRRASEAEKGSPWEAVGAAAIGLASAARREWGDARHWMGEYARIGRESGLHLNEISGLCTVSACDAETGHFDQAEAVSRTALEFAAQHGIDEHWCTAHGHLARGLVLDASGAWEEAEAAFERSAELARRGAGNVSVCWPLLHLARGEAARGNRGAARRRLEEARAAIATARDPGAMHERLDEVERGISGRPGREAAAEEELSERELSVLRLLSTDLSQREIGEQLFVSVNTVNAHSRRIFRKLGVSNRSEAVERARELSLL